MEGIVAAIGIVIMLAAIYFLGQMSHQKLLQQVIFLTLATLILVGCGGTAVAPTSTPVPPTAIPTPIPPTDTPTPPPAATVTVTPTPTPQTGRLEGKLVEAQLVDEGDAARPPLAGAFIVLCPKTSDNECIVDSELSTKSDSQQTFVFDSLSPGEYVVLYNPFTTVADVSAYWQYWDGRKLDLTDAKTVIGSFASAETVHVSSGPGGGIGVTTNPVSGKLEFTTVNGDTAIWPDTDPLIVEFVAEQVPLTVKITAGQTSEMKLRSHAKTSIPPTPTPTDTAVTVKVSPEVMEELSSWDEKIAFFTSAQNPITSLNGLSGDDVAMWGVELFENYKQLFQVLGEPKETGKVIGDVASVFAKNPKLRLFITWEKFEKDVVGSGGTKVRFEVGASVSSTNTPKPIPADTPTPVATPTPMAGIGVPVASQNWEVTIKSVYTEPRLVYTIGPETRTSEFADGHPHLVVDVKIRALDPSLRTEMESKDITSMVKLKRESGGTLIALGGGPDRNRLCDCEIYVLPGNGVKYALGMGLEDSISYPSNDVLYEGSLVFRAPDDTAQVLEFQFQDVPPIPFTIN